MSEIIKNYKVPVNVRKKTTIAGIKMYDEFNLYSDKLVGLNGGCEEITWFFKDFNTVQSANASLNTQFAQVVFVNAINAKVKPTIVSTTTNLGIINDVNRILFCSGMFSYAAANQYAQTLCKEILDVFNKYKASESNGQSNKQISQADELRKFKSLLDDGIITQEEFDAKKKQLLGL